MNIFFNKKTVFRSEFTLVTMSQILLHMPLIYLFLPALEKGECFQFDWIIFDCMLRDNSFYL